MGELGLLAALVAGVVVLTPAADRVNVPQPILLVIYGVVVAFAPGVVEPAIDAGLVLPVVLPPLLFAATQRTTVRAFRDAAAPVALLAVGLTVSTAAVVAVVAHAVGLSWQAAVVLGAVVSPPDPVAATAVARRLQLPERMVTILEGEGMFNDATALVMYKVAVAAAVTGAFSVVSTVVELVLAVGVGVAFGVVLGWLTTRALAALHDAAAETTVTIAAPFVAYLGAEHVRGSGVLAVLTLGLFLRSYAHPALTAHGWLLGRSVWEYADFLITSLVFVLVGFEVTVVVRHSPDVGSTLGVAGAVLAAVVVFRPVWLFPAAALARGLARRRDAPVPYGWRETAVVSWAGMRGVVTVATAVALPHLDAGGASLVWREPVMLVGLGCVLVTLVVQGLTLTPVVRFLGVGADGDDRAEVTGLQRRAMEAAVRALRAGGGPLDPAREAVILHYEARLDAEDRIRQALTAESADPSAADAFGGAGGLPGEVVDLGQRLRAAFELGTSAERDVALAARTAGEVSPAVADEVLRDIEARAAHLSP